MTAMPCAAPRATDTTRLEPHVRALYFVTGDTDPGLLARLLQPFAKLGLVPHRVHATSEHGDGSEQSVDLRVSGVPQRQARLIEAMLRATIGVLQVVMVIETA